MDRQFFVLTITSLRVQNGSRERKHFIASLPILSIDIGTVIPIDEYKILFFCTAKYVNQHIGGPASHCTSTAG